jgi:aryl-alcohol dehydrogenase-like predicted oxidoreductase
MVGFNFGDRSAAGEVIPAANQEGIGVIAMFALRSILNLRADEKTRLGKLLQDAGIQGPFALAYRYCRYQPGIDMVLTGTSDPTHLRQNIATALAPPLPPTVIERLQMEFPSKNQADVGST